MHFLDFVLRNLLRRKVRTALTVVGVSVAIAAVVALLSITGGYERSTKDIYSGHGVDMVVVRAGVANRETSTLDEGVAKRIEQLEGVGRVTMSLGERVRFAGSETPQPLNGWPPDSFAFDSLTILPPGRKLEADDKDAVMLGKVLAQSLKKQVGDQVEFESKKFKVIAICESGNMVENRSAFVLLSELQELMEKKGQVKQFEIALQDDVGDREAVMATLRKQIEDLRNEAGAKLGLAATPTEEFVRSDNQIRLAHAMAWVTGAIALVVGCIGMLNTMIVSVLERTQEIGILRAIGWRKVRIMRMIMIESFVLSFTGAVFGILLAYVLIRVLAVFPGAQGFVRGDITIQVVLMAYLLSVLVGLVGGAYPALRGASLPLPRRCDMSNHGHLKHPNQNGAPVILRVENVSRTYSDGEVTALAEVSLEIRRGEYVAIMGPSGSGKSTLLNLLGALDRPTTGELYFEGQPLSTLHDLDAFRSRKIGFVFQSFYLLPTLTAIENVQIPMFETGTSPAQRVKRAGQLLESVGLSHRMNHLPTQLSVGERQRVAIARSLANDPPLILADEPTGNLDSRSGNDVLNQFDQLHREHGKTLLVITHSHEVAERAERIIWIRDGRIVQSRAEALHEAV